MLRISYNIGMYNPVAKYLKATEVLKTVSTLKTTSTKTGYVIQALVSLASDMSVANNYDNIGEDY